MSRVLDRRALLGVGCAGLAAGVLPGSALAAQAQHGPDQLAASALPEQVVLWPEGVPEPAPPGLEQTYVQRSVDPAVSDRILRAVTAPFIEVHRPTGRNDGASIVLMPGGGYRHMAWDKEGQDLARWFSTRGVTAFVLAYRLPQDGWASWVEAPLADAQRALRLIRHRAADLGVDPARVAVMGFSAGGHLCANVAASFDRVVYRARDAVDAQSCRPAFAAAIYPAIKLDELRQALGAPADGSAMLERNSPHRNVRDDSPPHFLLHAEDDPLVDAGHPLALRAALVQRKIPVETHLFARGGHGFGLRATKGLPVDGWPERVMAFGRSTGWITA